MRLLAGGREGQSQQAATAEKHEPQPSRSAEQRSEHLSYPPACPAGAFSIPSPCCSKWSWLCDCVLLHSTADSVSCDREIHCFFTGFPSVLGAASLCLSCHSPGSTSQTLELGSSGRTNCRIVLDPPCFRGCQAEPAVNRVGKVASAERERGTRPALWTREGRQNVTPSLRRDVFVILLESVWAMTMGNGLLKLTVWKECFVHIKIGRASCRERV